MQNLSHKSGAREIDDFPGNKHLYVLPHHYCDKKTIDSETRFFGEVGTAYTVGARLHSDDGGKLDAP
jgi:hypothetical protein